MQSPKKESLRILTVCRMGQIRSVTAANLLREAGHVTTAVGIKHLRAMRVAKDLGVDLVLVVDFPEHCERTILARFPDAEVRVMETGKDIWRKVDHPELVAKLKELIGDLL